MKRAELLKSHGFKYFDKVPAGYPCAGCVRYKKVLSDQAHFLAAVIGATWVLMSCLDCRESYKLHERLVHADDEIEDFILEHDEK